MFGFLKAKKKEEKENPLKSQRFNDGILIVTHNDANKTIKIEAANMNAVNMLGYQQDELLDKDLREFLTSRVVDDINEFLEFPIPGADLDTVLNRIRRFKMRRKGDEALSLSLRVVRSLSTEEEPRFQMILNDGSLFESLEENREKYRADLRGNEIFDNITGLLSRESITKDIELIGFYSGKRDIHSSLAKIEITNYSKIISEHGAAVAKEFLRAIAAKVKENKRENDIIGVLNEGVFAIILTETPQDSVKIPVERLKEILVLPKYEVEVDGKKFHIEPEFEIGAKQINKETSKELALV